MPQYDIRKFEYHQKLEHFYLELCPKPRTYKISPRQVDRVVNKTCRRRSSLLTTPIQQSTSRGCIPFYYNFTFILHEKTGRIRSVCSCSTNSYLGQLLYNYLQYNACVAYHNDAMHIAANTSQFCCRC